MESDECPVNVRNCLYEEAFVRLFIRQVSIVAHTKKEESLISLP